MATLLITGGAGFIGSHTCLRLIEFGHKIIVLDDYSNSSPESLKRIKQFLGEKASNILNIYKGDIRDKNLLEDIFIKSLANKNPIEAVIHFAGLKAVAESTQKPLKYWDVNVNGSLCLFEVMSKFKCQTIVFSSSATVYGSASNEVINENNKIKPENPYGETKAAIEKILNGLYHSSPEEWKIANLRYFNPIGSHESGLIGEDPCGIPNNLFPLICKVATGNKEKIEIFGKDWPTPDGTPIRDYIHVMDLAEGHCLALEHLMTNSPKNVYLNLGTGKGTSVLEIIKIFEKTNNINIPYEFVGRRNGDSCITVADNSYSKKLLNWLPTRNIEVMCRDGWNWQKRNPSGYE